MAGTNEFAFFRCRSIRTGGGVQNQAEKIRKMPTGTKIYFSSISVCSHVATHPKPLLCWQSLTMVWKPLLTELWMKFSLGQQGMTTIKRQGLHVRIENTKKGGGLLPQEGWQMCSNKCPNWLVLPDKRRFREHSVVSLAGLDPNNLWARRTYLQNLT